MPESLNTTPAARLAAVKSRIDAACRACGRTATDVTLVAVSKTHPPEAIARLADQGQVDFGENYVKEATTKIQSLSDRTLFWHFIGHIQSNKCAEIARHFDWVHSVERVKTARRLSDAALEAGRILNVMLQVNLDGGGNKSGVSPASLPALIDDVAGFDGIRVRGLMAIPEPSPNEARQRETFAALRRLRDDAAKSFDGLEYLSMGMSADLESAILEGATHVRIGTALFGPRDYSR
ncbi:MAG: YggS family pyridoxal phosphate-dependent enzyme [Proteobacteria bacterium]|nr:MAG: YggS family pyridoxal phosphate-dependent enzyme [Pseudomonadota bacterium]